MVQKLFIMEDDEDLEALRLAALQTIRPRKSIRRPIASVTAHRQLEKQSFFRLTSNPNLIAIVPTDPRNDVEVPESSPVRNGIDGSGDSNRTVRTQLNVKEGGKSKEEKLQEKEKSLRVRFKSNTSVEVAENKDGEEDKSSNNTTVNTQSSSDSNKNSDCDQTENINFDEDELDFEGDTVTLHDDDDSLDRLMDEMEQEFSQGTLSATNNKSNQNKSKQNKTVTKSNEANSNATDVGKSGSASKSSSLKQSSSTRSQTPSGQSSRKSSSPVTSPRIQSPPLRKRLSPSSPPPPRRRSPSPSRQKRRRSSHTPPRRFSRSPASSRSNVSTKYGARSRSPFSNKRGVGRRMSESPRRRNSPSSLGHKGTYRNNGSPSRRKSPLTTNLKRRSTSPSCGRHRRSPKRSPDRSIVQTHPPESKPRWKSHHKKVISQHKREFSSRNSKVSRHTSPSQRVADENKPHRNDKKSTTSRIVENINEKKQKECSKPEESSLDPKFEARRRKFESSVFITPGNKKICLKSSSDDNSLKKIEKKTENYKEECLEIRHSEEEDSPQRCSPTDSHNRKSYSQETVGRRVTTVNKETSPLMSSNKKKSVILKECGQPQRVRIDRASLTITTENRPKSNNHSVIKLSEDKCVSCPDPDIQYINSGNGADDGGENIKEDVVEIKKVIKKKKKNKELKRKREILLGEVSGEKVREKRREGKKEELTMIASKHGNNINKPSLDLRAELSRRRAERLKGVTNPMARIIQSAFEDVVANRKKFDSKSTIPDKESDTPSTSGLIYKSKGSRRVHVLEDSSATSTSSYKKIDEDLSDEQRGYSEEEELEDEEASGGVDVDDEDDNRKFSVTSTTHRNTSLRTTSVGSGRSILRRSQV
ncbi:uncharacterized protein isoform X3 [Rhodnius prolixus]